MQVVKVGDFFLQTQYCENCGTMLVMFGNPKIVDEPLLFVVGNGADFGVARNEEELEEVMQKVAPEHHSVAHNEDELAKMMLDELSERAMNDPDLDPRLKEILSLAREIASDEFGETKRNESLVDWEELVGGDEEENE